jgi:hypothetical protein
MMTKEVAAFDQLGHLSLPARLTAANTLFLCKLLVAVIACNIVRSRADALGCINAYVHSVFVLALYGIVQELAFLATGNPLTPMYTHGLLGGYQRVAAAEVFGVTFLRVHSFSMEPKDLALFLVPAIAFLSASLSVARANRGRRDWFRWTQLAIMIAAGLLTFSTSLVLAIPPTIVAVELIRPSLRLKKKGRRAFAIILICLCAAPLYSVLWSVRVGDRVAASRTGIFQESREAPAIQFFEDHLPRSLFGYGVGTQAFYLPTYMSPEFRNMVLMADASAGIDSFWFSILLDLGLPGIILVAYACKVGLGIGKASAGSLANWPYRAAFLGSILICVALQGDLRAGVIWLFMVFAYRACNPDVGGTANVDVRRLRPLRPLYSRRVA